MRGRAPAQHRALAGGQDSGQIGGLECWEPGARRGRRRGVRGAGALLHAPLDLSRRHTSTRGAAPASPPRAGRSRSAPILRSTVLPGVPIRSPKQDGRELAPGAGRSPAGSASLRRHVRLQSRRRGGRDHGRGDRSGDRLRRHPSRPQGREAGVRGHGPREGPSGDRGAARQPGLEGEDHPGGRRPPARGDPRAHHRHDRVRRLRRRGLRDRGRARADGDQADGLRRARRGHAGPRDPRVEHLVAVRHRDGGGHAPAGQGLRLPLLLPRLDDAADRGDRGRGDLGRDAPGGLQLRPGDPQDGGPLRRGAGLRREPDPASRRCPRSGGSPRRRTST